jgi:outer membrane protein TolC
MEFISQLTKDFYEGGSNLNIKKTDYLSVQVTVTLIESIVAKLEQNRELVRSAISNTMGLPWDKVIEPVYSDNDILPPNYVLSDLIKEAYKTNTDIKNMDIALKISQEQIKEANAGHYPNVVLMGEVSHTYNSYEYGYLADDKENQWSVGFAVDIPLFDGLKTTNSVKEKELNKKKMYLLNDMLKEGVALQIKNELTKASIGFKQIQTLKKSKKLAKENRELNIKGYQIGAIDPEDVIQTQYIEAYVKADYLKYVHDYLLSLATIDKLIGQELK